MNQLQVFENKEFGQVRTVMIENEPYFVGKDVATILGYERPAKAILDHVDNEDKDEIPIQDSIGRMQKTPIINESGLYSLILSSKLPKAKQFKRWVTSEVLPSIRKQGYYSKEDEKVQKLELQKARTEAMLLNAKSRAFNTLMKSIDNKHLSPIAIQVFGLKGLESVFGVNVGNLLPKTEKTYSAAEVGEMLGISAVMVGKLANSNGLKTEEYGIFVMDKSKYSAKEVSSFRYNEKGVKALQALAW